MHLLQVWKESLAVFLPAHSKLFFLVTLKTFIETIKIWLKKFWWLLALYMIIDVSSLWLYKYSFRVGIGATQQYNLAFEYASLGLATLMLWTLFLTVRPSIQLKIYSYYFNYWVHFIWFLVSSLLLFFIIKHVDTLIVTLNYKLTLEASLVSPVVDMVLRLVLNYLLVPIVPFGSFLGVFQSLLYAPLFVFCILALLDTSGGIKDIFKAGLRSLKLIWYTYPFLWLITYFFTFLASLNHYIGFITIAMVIGGVESFPLATLITFDTLFLLIGSGIYTLYLCIMMNVYIKQMHQNFTRYY